MSDMERNPKIDALLGDTGDAEAEQAPPKGRAPGTRDDAEVDYEPEDPVSEARPNVDLDGSGVRTDREARRERSEELTSTGVKQSEGRGQQRRGDEGLEQGEQESDSAFQQRLREAREQAEREAQQWHYWQQQAALQRQQNPQQQPPDYYEDPAEYLRWQQQQLNQKLQEIDAWRQQQAQAAQQATQEDRFRQLVEAGEQEVRQRYPDYDDAVEFLKNQRDQELKQWGIRDQNQRRQVVQNEILQLTNTALSAGLNPGERAYEMAQRWGWNNNGQRRDDPQAPLNYEREFDRELQQVKKSPSKKSGKSQQRRASNRAPSLEELADLDGEAFDREWNRVMGRSWVT